MPRFVPITGKALLSFIHLLNKHSAIDGLMLKNILNIVPGITNCILLWDRDTRHTNVYTIIVCDICFDREEQRTRKRIRKGCVHSVMSDSL